jgi:serine/threonine protein kinase
MSQATSTTNGYLLLVAAKAMAPLVPGCAGFLATQSSKVGHAARNQPVKGITYFGPRIVDEWLAELQSRPQIDQQMALTQLATLTPDESRQAAKAALAQLLPEGSPEDQMVAFEYLATVPLAIRRSLMLDPTTGEPTLFPTISADTDNTLIRVLPADVPPFPIGTLLPGTSYHLEELLGIGGFGAVYKARNRFEQNQPPRAIKFCLDSSMLSTLHRERAFFDRLMNAGGQDWSERIVRLYGYALDVQPPFLVYEYVPGGDLTSHLNAQRRKTGRGFRPAVAFELARQVAEALAFAHEKGLAHRDLKPANILVSGATIKLTDFGIGAVVAAAIARGNFLSGSITHLSSAVDRASLFRGSGTPLYMSAEQRRGEEPDPRHDLYSLGVVWYQLLVGDVTRELHPGWPDELIEEFQVPQTHIELIQRCVGYFKKRPSNAGQLLDLMLMAQRNAKPQAVATSTGQAESEKTETVPTVSGCDEEFLRLQALLADQIDQDTLFQARQTVALMLRLQPEDAEALEARDFIEGRLASLPHTEIACFQDHEGWVRAVAVAPDSRRVLSTGDDASIRIWDLKSLQEIRRLEGHTAAVMTIALRSDGLRALSGGWDGTLRLWDLNSGRQLREIAGPWKAIKGLDMTADGRRAVCCADDNLLHLIDVDNGRELGQLAGHSDLIQSVATSADGRRALTGSDDKTVRLWDLVERCELRRFEGHSDTITGVALSPDGRWFVSSSSDYTVRVWDINSGTEIRRLCGHTNWINSVAVSADGSRILTGSGGELSAGKFRDGADTTVRLWDAKTGKALQRFDGHLASVTSVALSPNGAVAVSGSLDHTVRVWEIK